MLYIFLLYSSPEAWAASSRPEEEVLCEHGVLMRELEAAGKYKTSNALGPAETATTVQVREGKTLLVDGPFAETKEQLLGYYLVDAKNLDDAVAIGARIPDAAVGSVEIRPIREVEV
jgi:hypothetical protein